MKEDWISLTIETVVSVFRKIVIDSVNDSDGSCE
jgi:hypothetical protein